jgi:uncharacterized membrane protein
MSDDTAVAALAYIGIGIIWFFIDESVRYSDLAHFHVKQALNLYVLGLAASVALNILSITVIFLPVVWIVAPLLSVFATFMIILGIYNAVNHIMEPLPAIGQFADHYLHF